MSPLLAQSGHADRAAECPLSGVKRTSSRHAEVAAVKPRRRELGIADGVLDRPVAKRAKYVEELVSPYYNITFAGDSVEKFRRFLCLPYLD
jgi:hypothetical protein